MKNRQNDAWVRHHSSRLRPILLCNGNVDQAARQLLSDAERVKAKNKEKQGKGKGPEKGHVATGLPRKGQAKGWSQPQQGWSQPQQGWSTGGPGYKGDRSGKGDGRSNRTSGWNR